jgi:hypothetical protein
MKKTVLNEVLKLLKEHRLVQSESEFSKDWLGRSESYMRGLRFHKDTPSISCIAICASKLQHYGQRLARTGMHDALSQRFIELSEACHRQINAESEALWLRDVGGGVAD